MEFQHSFIDSKLNIEDEIRNINSERIPIIIILDGLTDIGNVGIIFRLADALKIEKIIIFNYNKIFNYKLLHRKSRATIQYVPYEYINNINDIIKLKQKHKFVILDKTNYSVPYFKTKYSKPMCLIIGSEINGVSEELIKLAEQSIHLPMFGINTSINVATATSVALYHIYNQLKKY